MQHRCSTRLQLHAGPTFVQVHLSFACVCFGWVMRGWSVRRRYVRMARAFFSLSPARLLLLCGRRCCVSQAVSLDDDVCRTFDLRVGAGIGFWGVSGFIGTAGRLDLSATGMYITILIPCAVDGPTACCVFATFVFVSVCWIA